MYIVSKVGHFCNVVLERSAGISPERIDYYDMTLVFKGRLIYTANGQRLTVEAGDVILLPPSTLRTRLPLSEPVHYVSFNFNSDEKIDLQMLIKGGATAEIHALFDAFTPSHLTDEPRSEQKAACIASYILEVLTEMKDRESHNLHVNRAIDFVSAHIKERIGLSDVAKHLHLSREYTAFLFKREMKMTVSEFINRKRLAIARDMIRDGGLSLSEVSEAVGYESYGYFSRLFKKRYGVAPISCKS
ncbi:MAG: helix-turn-helix transcriptional regulator [Clostridia bacterium]|nr:helix-turn-helix transcriptional regulator [Clostridia bacterium]